ncbi:OsmC family protein, partial [Vibrio parahaemolyticus]|nr:OsmC family protein [Vibrio parahaemolyticus]
NQYSRAHTWRFDGGLLVPASPSPHVVPLPLSVEENVDPEEAFVAALSSCHMLVFLSIAAKRRYVIDSYVDAAEGELTAGENGKVWVSRVVLNPKVVFSGDKQPSYEQLEKMHHMAHENCFIANSVKTEIVTNILHSD